jgi:hypothetical protein
MSVNEYDNDSDNETIIANNEPNYIEDEDLDDNNKQYCYKSRKYNEYKDITLGLSPENTKYCNKEYILYEISGNELNTFCSSIKKYGMNLTIAKKHHTNITEELLNDKEPKFYLPLIIIEYHNYKSNDFKNLIEIIDGHHRITAIKNAIEKEPILQRKLYIELKLIYSDEPNSHKTRDIFRKINLSKPFLVNFKPLEIIEEVRVKLNNIYNKGNFVFIKDAIKVNRPSFILHDFSSYMQKKIIDLCESNIDISTLNSDSIVQKITELNKNYSAFDTNFTEFAYKFKLKKIDEKIFNKSKLLNCYIGLFDYKSIIDKCIISK